MDIDNVNDKCKYFSVPAKWWPQVSTPAVPAARLPRLSHNYPLPLSPPLLQSPPHPLDFPLLYHLLMLQNYCHQNYQDTYSPDLAPGDESDQPLDLSSKSESESNSVSGFLSEDNKISYDESIKQNEEVEVVHKDDIEERSIAQLGQKKEESVKDFVRRKIKEHRKTDEEFKRLVVCESNPKEKDIQRKMTKIKEKYCHINNKIKKLDALRTKLKTPSNPTKELKSQPCTKNNDLNVYHLTKDTTIAQKKAKSKITNREPPRPSLIQKKTVKRKLSFETVEKSDVGERDTIECDSSRGEQVGSSAALAPEHLHDSLRVLLLQPDSTLHPGRLSVLLPPDIYGVKAGLNIWKQESI